MAIALAEPQGRACLNALDAERDVVISATTLAETLIVAAGRNVGERTAKLLHGFGFTVVPVDAATAERVAGVYTRWGRGNHPASLNFCDCFAYDVAHQAGVRLLFIGNDFALTDVESVL